MHKAIGLALLLIGVTGGVFRRPFLRPLAGDDTAGR